MKSIRFVVGALMAGLVMAVSWPSQSQARTVTTVDTSMQSQSLTQSVTVTAAVAGTVLAVANPFFARKLATVGNGTYHDAFKPYCLVDGIERQTNYYCDDLVCDEDDEPCTWEGGGMFTWRLRR